MSLATTQIHWPPFTGPSGQSVPAQVSQTAEGLFKADFVPRLVGEHRVSVTVQGQATAGSPYAAKVNMINNLIIMLLFNLLLSTGVRCDSN